MTATIHHRPLHMKLGNVCSALAAIGIAVGAAFLLQRMPRERFVIPDEKAAAAALLMEKLSGPRYFQFRSPPTSEHPPVRAPFLRDRGPRISVPDAHAQVERVAAERQFDAKHAATLHQLVDELAESSESRMAGQESVNLLRLNLALDELR